MVKAGKAIQEQRLLPVFSLVASRNGRTALLLSIIDGTLKPREVVIREW